MANNDYNAELSRWIECEKVDKETKRNIEKLTDDEKESAFCEYLSFGTAGLRAKMGPGIARMNEYTVAHAANALSKLIIAEGENATDRGVVIAFDSRNNSELFAIRSAQVLSAYGIKTYLFDSLRPTPVLSFAVRYLYCIAGINITASHNPKEYNGYKVYWEDGAQIGPEQASKISTEMKNCDILFDVPTPSAAKGEFIFPVPDEVDEEYVNCVLAEGINFDEINNASDKLTIVYTPLHGAGIKMVPEVLRRAGVNNMHIVHEQAKPDGDFPTVRFPNPEFPEAFRLGLETAEQVGSSLIIATDPDSDRVGVMAKNSDGEFKCITGNQMGALLLDYIITAYKKIGKFPKEPYAVKSVVSSALAAEICKRNNVKMYDVLTGFKYIGEVIKKHEETGSGTFLLGFEESYGYLKGTYARDKDAVVATLLICEMASYYMNRNMTLTDALEKLYEKYGYYYEKTIDIYLDRPDGQQVMASLMAKLRFAPPKVIGSKNVVQYRDYLTGTVYNTIDNTTVPTGLPKTNMIYSVTEDGDVMVVRPSGTEPKIKIYILVKADTMKEARSYAREVEKWINAEMNV